jgi:hypothetical protein
MTKVGESMAGGSKYQFKAQAPESHKQTPPPTAQFVSPRGMNGERREYGDKGVKVHFVGAVLVKDRDHTHHQRVHCQFRNGEELICRNGTGIIRVQGDETVVQTLHFVR